MNDVGGSGSGLKAVKSSRTDANFEDKLEYDDSEWDVGIGNLIIDLDADIEKNNEVTNTNSTKNPKTTKNTTATIKGTKSNTTNPTTNTTNKPATEENKSHVISSIISKKDTSPISPNNTSIKTPASTTCTPPLSPTILSNTNTSISSTNTKTSSTSTSTSSTPNSSSSSTTKQMHIPHSPAAAASSIKNKIGEKTPTSPSTIVVPSPSTDLQQTSSTSLTTPTTGSTATTVTTTTGKRMDQHSAIVDKGLKMKIKRTKTGTKSDAKHEIVKSDGKGVYNKEFGGNKKDNSVENNGGSAGESSGKGSPAGKSSGKNAKKGSTATGQYVKKVKSDNSPSTGPKVSGGKGKDGDNSSLSDTPVALTTATKVSTVGKELFSLNVPNPSSISSNNSSNNSQVSTSAFVKTTSTSSISPSLIGGLGKIQSSPILTTSGQELLPPGVNSSTNNVTNSLSKCLSYGLIKESVFKSSSDKVSSNSNSNLSLTSIEAKGISTKKSKTQDSGVGMLSPTAAGSSTFRPQSTTSNDLNNMANSHQHQGVGKDVKTAGPAGLSRVSPASSSSSSHKDACVMTSVGTITEPDLIGPCEPGTTVHIEGIVWHELEGVLVVNVTWRGKTYVGTLLDCKMSNDWAPPRFCDSPTSDLEARTPKNRSKRGRANTNSGPNALIDNIGNNIIEAKANSKLRNGGKGGRKGIASTSSGLTGNSSVSAAASFATPISPYKGSGGVSGELAWGKRKTRGSETDSIDNDNSSNNTNTTGPKNGKKQKLSNQKDGSPTLDDQGRSSPVLIECPEPNCSKKYRHINGLRYHTSHAHNFNAEDSDSNMSTTSNLTQGHENNVSTPPPDTNSDNTDGTITVEEQSASNSKPLKPTPTSIIEKNDKIYDLPSDMDMEIDEPIALNKHLNLHSKNKDSSTTSLDTNTNTISNTQMGTAASRTPILTVPSVPFLSNRNSNSTTTSGPNSNNKVSSTPWQPHASSGSSGSGLHSSSHPAYVISTAHQPQPVTLTVPIPVSTTSASDVNKKDKPPGGSDKSKKPKHKKKNKEKDREKTSSGHSHSKSQSDESHNNKSSIYSHTSGGTSDKHNDERISDGAGGGSNNCGNIGENRDDPTSPAYSDISEDGNDSGGEQGGGLMAMKDGNCKSGSGLGVIVPTPDLSLSKKDTVILTTPSGIVGSAGGGPSGGGSFYPSFYSPYNLDSRDKQSVNNNSDGPGKPPQDSQQDLDKNKQSSNMSGKTTGSSGPPLNNNLSSATTNANNDRNSPKMDFHHPKYLPQQQQQQQQQHFFHYPYSNYHFDGNNQSQSGSPYNQGPLPPPGHPDYHRSLQQQQHQQQQQQQQNNEDKGKSTNVNENSNDSVVGDRLLNIKIEPGLERERDKGKSSIDDKRSSPSLGGSGKHHQNQHFTPCSKHSKNKERSSFEGGKDSSGNKSSPNSANSAGSNRNSTDKKFSDNKDDGIKPTFETQGPPPPPTSGNYNAYGIPNFLQASPFGLPFDPGHPLYRQVMVGNPFTPGPGPFHHPGLHHPNSMRFPGPPPGSTPLPEDLSGQRGGGPPTSSATTPSSKALDLLQHHANQYFASHKIHELQERALKSPSPQVFGGADKRGSIGGGIGAGDGSPHDPKLVPPSVAQPNSMIGGPSPTIRTSTMEKTSSISSSVSISSGGGGGGKDIKDIKQASDLTKEMKINVSDMRDGTRTPPTQHHVHTHQHHHTHIGVGYPIIPAVTPQYSSLSPHYGVPPAVITPATYSTPKNSN